MGYMVDELLEGARIATEICMGVKGGESVLIVADKPMMKIARALAIASDLLDAETMIMMMKPRRVSGEEPPKPVAEAMASSDVVLAPTTKSLTHTEARRRACERGARIATMPGITEDCFVEGAMLANYEEVAEISRKLARALSDASEAKIITWDRELRLSLAGRRALADTGIYRNPGDFGNLPAGEAFIAPIEGESEGSLLVDGSIADIGLLRSPLELEVSEGRITGVSGDRAIIEELEKFLNYDERARVICELGIGCNPRARFTGNVLEDEKIWGTVHVAFGNNTGFGGFNRSGIHIDLVIRRCKLYLDGEKIVEEGRILLDVI